MDEHPENAQKKPKRRKQVINKKEHVAAGVGDRQQFLILVNLPAGTDEMVAFRVASDVVEQEIARAILCNRQALAGPLTVGPRGQITIDSAAGHAESPATQVIEFSGGVKVRDSNVQNPLKVRLDRDVYVQLRDLFLLFNRAFKIRNGGGSITLGGFEEHLTLTDGKLSGEKFYDHPPDPIVEVNLPGNPEVNVVN